MKSIIISSIVLLYVTVVLARSTDDSHKRNHEKSDHLVGKRHHDQTRHEQHISKKHRDHESQSRHSQHRHGCGEPPSTPFDDLSSTTAASYEDSTIGDSNPPQDSTRKRHRGGGRISDMSRRGGHSVSSRKAMKRDSQNIWESIGSLMTCLPQIFTNIPIILLKELNVPPLKNRTLQLTINGQIVYSIVFDPQMSICANPNYDGCQILSGIINISSNVLPNFGPDFNNRVNCIRQIMCNVTQAIVTDLNTQGLFSRREIILQLDDNVIFRFITGIFPSCDVGSTATTSQRAIGSETQKRVHKKHSEHPKLKRALEYEASDDFDSENEGSPLDDSLGNSAGTDIHED